MTDPSQKFCLPSTIQYRTLFEVARELERMDATAEAIIKKLRESEQQIRDWQDKAAALRTTLREIGIGSLVLDNDAEKDEFYVRTQPFKYTSLVDTCKEILQDFPDTPLSKNDVEFMAFKGGYRSQARISVNSFDVTLRRLADSGFCEVEKGSGPKPNLYVYKTRQKGDDAPSTKQERK